MGVYIFKWRRAGEFQCPRTIEEELLIACCGLDRNEMGFNSPLHDEESLFFFLLSCLQVHCVIAVSGRLLLLVGKQGDIHSPFALSLFRLFVLTVEWVSILVFSSLKKSVWHLFLLPPPFPPPFTQTQKEKEFDPHGCSFWILYTIYKIFCNMFTCNISLHAYKTAVS